MTREEFLKKGLALGIGFPLLSLFHKSCDDAIEFPQFQTNFSGKVIVIGAGAAGMAAGYLLNRYGIDFQIIEASPNLGGRVKRSADFTNFPIDLGAEWIHTSPSVLADILNDPEQNANIDFITYNPQTFQLWNNGKLKDRNFARNFYSEYKFKNTTWYGFFEKYIVPDFQEKIIVDTPIIEIDYSTDKVKLTSVDDEVFEADKIVVTIPIKVLQSNVVSFNPAMPSAKSEAINSIYMGDGLKAFIEFKERFYPDILLFGGLINAISSDDKTYYDAAFRKDTDKNILGLFTINEKAAEYATLNSDEEIIAKILAELDEIFDGQASQHYVKHVIQNWSKEPYIQGAYSYSFANDQEDTVNELLKPLDNKVFFAGEALSIDNQATVHGACESAYEVVENLLKA